METLPENGGSLGAQVNDYEGFEGISLSEYSDFEQVVEYADFIEKHGALGGKLYQHYGNLEGAEKALVENYAGNINQYQILQSSKQRTRPQSRSHSYII